MTSRYRRDEHDDLPDTSAFNSAVATRRRNAERAVLRDIANELTKQDALAPAELDGLLKTNYEEYFRRTQELERKR